MRSVEPLAMYINRRCETWYLPRNFVPAFSLPSLSIVSLPSPLIVSCRYTNAVVWRVHRAPETPWPAMHTFLNIAMAHVIVGLHVARKIIALKHDAYTRTSHLHTNSL